MSNSVSLSGVVNVLKTRQEVERREALNDFREAEAEVLYQMQHNSSASEVVREARCYALECLDVVLDLGAKVSFNRNILAPPVKMAEATPAWV
jgi:hypothetical protein